MADDYGMGNVLGIMGAGVQLYALKNLVDTVGNMSKPRKKQYYKVKQNPGSKKQLYVIVRDRFGKVKYVPYR